MIYLNFYYNLILILNITFINNNKKWNNNKTNLIFK